MEGLKRDVKLAFGQARAVQRSVMYQISRNPGNHTILAAAGHNRGVTWAGAAGLRLPRACWHGAARRRAAMPISAAVSPVLVKLVTGFPQSTAVFHGGWTSQRSNYNKTLPANDYETKMLLLGFFGGFSKNYHFCYEEASA